MLVIKMFTIIFVIFGIFFPDGVDSSTCYIYNANSRCMNGGNIFQMRWYRCRVSVYNVGRFIMLGKIESRASYRTKRGVNTVQTRFNHSHGNIEYAEPSNTHSCSPSLRLDIYIYMCNVAHRHTFGLFSLRAQIRFCCVVWCCYTQGYAIST